MLSKLNSQKISLVPADLIIMIANKLSFWYLEAFIFSDKRISSILNTDRYWICRCSKILCISFSELEGYLTSVKKIYHSLNIIYTIPQLAAWIEYQPKYFYDSFRHNIEVRHWMDLKIYTTLGIQKQLDNLLKDFSQTLFFPDHQAFLKEKVEEIIVFYEKIIKDHMYLPMTYREHTKFMDITRIHSEQDKKRPKKIYLPDIYGSAANSSGPCRRALDGQKICLPKNPISYTDFRKYYFDLLKIYQKTNNHHISNGDIHFLRQDFFDLKKHDLIFIKNRHDVVFFVFTDTNNDLLIREDSEYNIPYDPNFQLFKTYNIMYADDLDELYRKRNVSWSYELLPEENHTVTQSPEKKRIVFLATRQDPKEDTILLDQNGHIIFIRKNNDISNNIS
jgi:hypothetical protein